MVVSVNYRSENDGFTTDNTEVSRATSAINKAKDIVDKTTGTPLERMTIYKTAICEITSYNDDAANTENYPYGDPWQLVYVFDGDPDTNVVCEGYSKAFKYLFDLSKFGSFYDCILATGSMIDDKGPGPHMWNVVRMDGGKNYLVDVTNCDEGSIGAPDVLFMAYGPSGSWNGEAGYTFAVPGENSIKYIYDPDTISTFGESQLKISAEKYVDSAAAIAPGIVDNSNYSVPANLTYGSINCTLSVIATAADGHELSYQWYDNSANSNEGGTAVPGATGETLTLPEKLTAGDHYFYCVVTATRTANGKTASAKSGPIYVPVARKNLTNIGFAVKTYDGTDTATVQVYDGIIGEDDVKFDAHFADANAGDDKPVTITLTGESAGNYTVPANVMSTINQRPLLITAKPQTIEVGGSIETGVKQVETSPVDGYNVSGLVAGQSLAEITLTPSNTATAGTGTITPSAAKIVDVYGNDVTKNYSVTYATGTLTVTKKKPALPAAVENLVYNGQAQALVTVNADKCGTYVYGLSTNDIAPQSWDNGIITCENAGTYYVWYKADENETYEAVAPDYVTVTIAPKSIDAATVTLNATSFNYDGKAKTVSIDSVTLDGASPDYEMDGDSVTSAIDAGTYTVKVNGKGNYTGSASATWTINPIPVAGKEVLTSAQMPTGAPVGYAGASQPLVNAPTNLPEHCAEVQYSIDGGQTWSSAIPTASQAGSYTVRVMYVGEKNYASFEGDPITVTIPEAPKPAPAPDPAPAPASAPAPDPAPAPAPAPAPGPQTIYSPKANVKATVSVGTVYQIDTAGGAAKSFKSSNKKVAVVDQSGIVTPRNAGKAKITFKVGKKKRTVTLKVVDPTVPTRLSLNMAGTVAVKKGETVLLQAVLPDGANSAVKWKSSNRKVASVNAQGVVTFRKKGTATITATAVRGKKKAKVKFRVSN